MKRQFSVNRVRRITVLSLTAFAILSAGYLPVQPVQCSPTWRSISREANIDLDDKALSKATAGYLAAIACLERTDPDTESKYDLYLNLAETYRRNQEFDKAQKILDSLQPVIASKQWDDPLLPARYWSRRADFCLSTRNIKGYIDAQARAIAVVGKCMPEECHDAVVMRVGFVNKLCELEQWDSVPAVVRQLKLVKSDSAKEKMSVDFAVSSACRRVRAVGLNFLEAKKLQDAEKTYALLTDIDPDPGSLLLAWRDWVSSWAANKQSVNPDQAVQSISTVLARLPDKFGRNGSIQLVGLHALTGLFEQLNRKEQALSTWMRIREIARTERTLSAEDLVLWCTACELMARDEMVKGKTVDPSHNLRAQNLLVEQCRLTEMKNGPVSGPEARAFAIFHFSSRLNLSQVNARLRLPEQGEQVLSTISPASVKVFPAGDVRLVARHLDNCKAFALAGKTEQAWNLLDNCRKLAGPIILKVQNKTADVDTVSALQESNILGRIQKLDGELRSQRMVKHQ